MQIMLHRLFPNITTGNNPHQSAQMTQYASYQAIHGDRFSSRTQKPTSESYQRAEELAKHLHIHRFRKSPLPNRPKTPYFTHLDNVAQTVRRYGASEYVQIAALKHDDLEDIGDEYPGGVEKLRQDIRNSGPDGDVILAIVEGCTEASASERPKPSWDRRKENYLEHIRTLNQNVTDPRIPIGILYVSVADKLDSATDIVNNLKDAEIGPERTFEIFKDNNHGGKVGGTLWFFRSLVEAYRSPELEPYVNKDLVNELAAAVDEMHRLAPAQPEGKA